MMHYKAREIARHNKGTGLFHYTVKDRHGVMPVGYCAQGCQGHESELGAYQHQRDYELDHHARLDLVNDNAQKRCKVCEAFTQGYAAVGYHHYPLCDEHRTMETLKTLHTVGESWES